MTAQASIGRVVLDAVTYVVVLVGLVFTGTTAVMKGIGSGWVGVKFALFFVGFGLFGYATFRLRPKPVHKRDENDDGSGEAITGFEQVVATVPPLRWYPVAQDARLSPATKLFVASLSVLVVSFLMEVAFGVAR